MIDLRVVERGLVPVYEDAESRQVVNARELHAFLGVGKDFSNWIKDRIEKYGFEEDVDFCFLEPGNGGALSGSSGVCSPNLASKNGIKDGRGGHNVKTYLLTLDTAKEIAMAENSERGRQVRKYFIACERKLKDLREKGISSDEMEEALTNPDTMLRIVSRWRDERNKRLALESKIEEDAPKVIFADAVAASKTTLLVGDVAKLLRQNGVMVGQQRLFEWLRENGWLMKIGSSRNMPTQAAMERGFFEVKETTICKPDGSIHISKTPKVTGRGQRFIVNCFIGEGPAA